MNGRELRRYKNKQNAIEVFENHCIPYEKHYQGLLVNKCYVFSVASFKWRHVGESTKWYESNGPDDFIKQSKLHAENIKTSKKINKKKVKEFFESKGITVDERNHVFLLNNKYKFSPTTYKWIEVGKTGEWLKSLNEKDFYGKIFCANIDYNTTEKRRQFAIEYFTRIGISVYIDDDGNININENFIYYPEDNTWKSNDYHIRYKCNGPEDLFIRFLSQRRNKNKLSNSTEVDKKPNQIVNETNKENTVMEKTTSKQKNTKRQKKVKQVKKSLTVREITEAKKAVKKELDKITNYIVNPDGSFTASITMTPEIAKVLVKTNPTDIKKFGIVNRSLNKAKVKEYVEEMKAGKWYFNNCPIIIAKDGTFLNGHHRCTACITGNVNFDTAILFNCDKKIMGTVDVGKTRDASDFMKMHGVDNASTFVSMLRLALLYKSETSSVNPQSKYKQRINIKSMFNKDETPDEFLIRHDLNDKGNGSLLDYYKIAVSARKNNVDMKIITPQKVATLGYFISNELGKDIATGFINKVYSYMGKVEGDPLSLYERYIINNRARGRDTAQYGFDICTLVGAWNRFVDGKLLKKFSGIYPLAESMLSFDIADNVELYIDENNILQRHVYDVVKGVVQKPITTPDII
jgi:hypothetical protein